MQDLAPTAFETEGKAHISQRRSLRRFAGIIVGAVLAIEIALAGCVGLYFFFTERASAALVFQDAFGSEFDAVQSVATEHASDAKLIGVSTDSAVEEEGACDWTYFFISRHKVSLFTVTEKDGALTAQAYGKASCARETEESIPEPTAVTIDAAEAFEKAVRSLPHDRRYQDCTASLVMYDAGAEDPFEGSLVWTFSFNELASDAEDSRLKAFSCTVDATTGAVSKVTESNTE